MKLPDHKKRIEALRQGFLEKGLEGVLVTSLNDIYYYTGKAVNRSDPGFLLVTKRTQKLFVTSLDNELRGKDTRIIESLRSLKKELSGSGNLGYDEKNLSVLMFRKLRTGRWKPFSQGIKAPRMIKDRYEISQLRQACRAAIKVLGSLRVRGKTEFQVATDIICRIREAGRIPGFDPLIAAGRYSGFVHHIPGNYRISRGPVIVDIGASQNQYNSDITRTLDMGLTAKQDRLIELSRSLHDEMIGMMKPGVAFASLQKWYAKSLKSAGFEVLISFGHGVGLSLHERPHSGDTLEKGMVLAVEPGVYQKGVGGCRFEDMVLVSDKPRLLH
jgi:Xaa-Pro dipeptidase